MNTYNKILFLDFDGVINSLRSVVAYNAIPHDHEDIRYEFDPIAVLLIQRIVKETGCKIVVSSAWRIEYTIQEIRDILKNNFNWKDVDDIIIDVTPITNHARRGKEIQQWIDEHTTGISNFRYAILDDDNDILDTQRHKFVKTDVNDGISYKDYKKVLELLQ